MMSRKRVALLTALLCLPLVGRSQTAITASEIHDHIAFLTSDKNQGRSPGGKSNKRVVRYLRHNFRQNDIKAFKSGYKQEFMARLRVDGGSEGPTVKTWNVIGYLPGKDAKLKDEYIVLGAHYDHLGLGGPSSKSELRNTVYHGADDNASGTAALLEIGEKLAAHRNDLKRSVILVAFGAEEQGLLGSAYFTAHPPVPLSQIKLMVNMDMVGRLNDKEQVYMGGAGTFPNGMVLMDSTGTALGLHPVVNAGSVGGSDHVSFYKKGISVLGLHTGGHPQYHTPDDTLDKINLQGEAKVCDYIYNVIYKIASTDHPLYFIPQD